MSSLRLVGAVAVLPPLPRQQQHRLQSSRAVHMRSLAELQHAAAMHTHPDVVYGAMIPDPDYSDDDLDNLAGAKLANITNASINNKTLSNSIFSKSKPLSPVCSAQPALWSSTSPSTSPPPPLSQSSSPSSASTSPSYAGGSAVAAATMVARNNRVNADVEETEPSLPPKSASPVLVKQGSPLLQQKENKIGRFDENGLVVPKKLHNPSLESTEKKSLHRELLFNQKIGVNVLNQKTELQKAMEKHKGKQMAKEQEREKQANLTPFQKALEQQALKLEQGTEKTDEVKKEPEATHEFQKMQAKLRSKLEVQ